jgi:hypothetical protein
VVTFHDPTQLNKTYIYAMDGSHGIFKKNTFSGKVPVTQAAQYELREGFTEIESGCDEHFPEALFENIFSIEDMIPLSALSKEMNDFEGRIYFE